VSGPVFLFCAPGFIFGGTKGVRSRFHFCASGLIFSGTEGVCAPVRVFGGMKVVESSFHDLGSRTCFRRYGGCRVLLSCLALPNTFSPVMRVPNAVFMFCALGVISRGTEGVRSRFHVLHARTHFRRYPGNPEPISYFALSDMFSAIPSASGHVFTFCAPRMVSVVPRATGLVLMLGAVFMFCALRVVSRGTEAVGCLFHILRSRTLFRRYRGTRVPFSSCALPDSLSAAVPSAFGPVFFFCAPGLIIGGTEGVDSFSCFVLLESFSAVTRASGPVFRLCTLGLIFGDTEGVGSRFHVLRSRSRFRRYQGRRVSFSYFARHVSISAIPTASGPIFMFSALGLIFGGA
jgi:hypothetical protein